MCQKLTELLCNNRLVKSLGKSPCAVDREAWDFFKVFPREFGTEIKLMWYCKILLWNLEASRHYDTTSLSLQIAFCACVVATTALEWNKADCFPKLSESRSPCREQFQKYENKLGYRIIKQLLNAVIAKYRDLSVSQVNYLPSCSPLHHDKWRYFAQTRPVIVK